MSRCEEEFEVILIIIFLRIAILFIQNNIAITKCCVSLDANVGDCDDLIGSFTYKHCSYMALWNWAYIGNYVELS